MKKRIFVLIFMALILLVFAGCSDANETAEILYNPEIKSDYMEIMTHIVSSFDTNCYFIANKQTGETIIADPGDNAALLIKMLEENELKPVVILLTHTHGDHTGAAEKLRKTFEIPVYAWIDEKANFSGFAVTKNITWLDDENAPLEIAGFSVRIIHTPGHTVGSVCYYVESENVIFSGDTMFRGRSGRTDLATGDLNAMIDSFKNKLYTLSDETIVYPGHGMTTVIGSEKEQSAINEFINTDASERRCIKYVCY